ncbi:CcdB-like protein [Enterobacterales bacterium]|nr:CcdB-like protein [Enterobacterales bacterium]
MQYHAYRNGSNSKEYPYLIDVQSDLIDLLETRMVIPLVPLAYAQHQVPVRISPIIDIEGDSFILMTSEMASVPLSILKEQICSVENQRQVIKDAVDFLFDGF